MKGFIKKLKTDKKFLSIVVILAIAVFFVPYIAIPALIIWWYYKKSKFSKKSKIITTSTIGALFAILIVWFGIAYATDAQPSLTITEPSSLTTTIQAPQVTIQGTYSPSDRTVEVNGQDIPASNGKFSTVYQLKQGENKIEVQAGKIKWAYSYLTVSRELTDAEKAAMVTPTTQPTMQTAQKTSAPIKTTKPTAKPTPTLSPIDQDKQAVKNAVTKVLLADMKLVEGDTKHYPNVDYSEYGINQKEPLIHEIDIVEANPDLGSQGMLNIEFSAIPFPLTVGYYNAAEEATVDILGALQSVKLNTPVNEITVAAWGMNKDPFGNPQCQNLKYMRMTFVEVTQDQLSLVTPEQWQDLNGQQEFDKMNSLGLKTELDTYYQACNQTSYEK